MMDWMQALSFTNRWYEPDDLIQIQVEDCTSAASTPPAIIDPSKSSVNGSSFSSGSSSKNSERSLLFNEANDVNSLLNLPISSSSSSSSGSGSGSSSSSTLSRRKGSVPPLPSEETILSSRRPKGDGTEAPLSPRKSHQGGVGMLSPKSGRRKSSVPDSGSMSGSGSGSGSHKIVSGAEELEDLEGSNNSRPGRWLARIAAKRLRKKSLFGDT
jgi:hypothetical protein